MSQEKQGIDPRYIYALTLRELKKSLPKECTFLAPFTNRKGQNMVKYIVKGQDYYSSIPPNFIFKKADFDELRDNILSKI